MAKNACRQTKEKIMNVKLLVSTVLLASYGFVANAQPPASPQTADTLEANLSVMNDMSAVLTGHLQNDDWYTPDGSHFASLAVYVSVAVPTRIDGFSTFGEVLDADIWIKLIGREGMYAKCQLVLQPIFGIGTPVIFKVQIAAKDNVAKPFSGLCDIDLEKEDIQLGVPDIRHGDTVVTYIKRASAREDVEFAHGVVKK